MNRKQSTSALDIIQLKIPIKKQNRTQSQNSLEKQKKYKFDKGIKIKIYQKQNINQNYQIFYQKDFKYFNKEVKNKQNQNINLTSKSNKKIKQKFYKYKQIKKDQNKDINKDINRYKLPIKKQKIDKKFIITPNHSNNKSLANKKAPKNLISPISTNSNRKIQKSTPKKYQKKHPLQKTNIKKLQSSVSFYTMSQTQAKQSRWLEIPQLTIQNPSNQNSQLRIYVTPSFIRTEPSSAMGHKQQSKISKINLMISMFQIRHKLSQSSYSTTFEVIHIQTNFIYCLKVFEKQKIKNQGLQQQIISQIKFRSTCCKYHKNIQKLYTFFDDEVYLYFVQEYLIGFGSIQKQLQIRRRYTQKQSGLIFKQVTQTIKYIHSQNYIHRDIKIRNLVRCFGIVKVVDFSWIASLKQKKYVVILYRLRDTFCGDYKYAPPQLIIGSYYDESIDVWSLGILLYELCTGQSPFREVQLNKKRNCHLMTFPIFLSNELVDLIGKLLNDKGTRMKIQQIQIHQWWNKWEVDGFVNKQIWDFWLL